MGLRLSTEVIVSNGSTGRMLKIIHEYKAIIAISDRSEYGCVC